MDKPTMQEILATIAGWTQHGGDLRYELAKMQAWRDLALRDLDFTEGDRVIICDNYTPQTDGGWAGYYECLRPGQTAVVNSLDVNPHYGYVYADIVMETEWSVYEYPTGTLNRAERGPDQRHTFMFPVKYLRRASDADAPIPLPSVAGVSTGRREAS